jgi:hypothetical protein
MGVGCVSIIKQKDFRHSRSSIVKHKFFNYLEMRAGERERERDPLLDFMKASLH